jgi:hypothetical protein
MGAARDALETLSAAEHDDLREVFGRHGRLRDR